MKSISQWSHPLDALRAFALPTEAILRLVAVLHGLIGRGIAPRRRLPMASSTTAFALFLAATAWAFATNPLTAAESVNGKSLISQSIFDPNRVVKVQITLAPGDWEKLRNQERDAKAEFSKDRLERPVQTPYTWFSADVTIDGTQLKNVGIRKRGFFGSADKERPG